MVSASQALPTGAFLLVFSFGVSVWTFFVFSRFRTCECGQEQQARALGLRLGRDRVRPKIAPGRMLINMTLWSSAVDVVAMT